MPASARCTFSPSPPTALFTMSRRFISATRAPTFPAASPSTSRIDSTTSSILRTFPAPLPLKSADSGSLTEGFPLKADRIFRRTASLRNS